MRSVARRVGCGLGVGVGLTAFALQAQAMPTIASPTPTAGSLVGDSVTVNATVTSPFVLTSVTAQIGGTSAPMASLPVGAGWRATLDISAEPIAPVTMTISATDANGETATTNVSLVHDHAPVLAVLTPTYAVARPSLALNATCTDTDAYGCASLTVAVKPTGGNVAPATVATTAAATLNQTVSLAAWEGRAIDVIFTATDAAGWATTKTLQAYVESSPHLALVEEIDGNVLDADATRVLFVNDGGVWVKDRATGVSSVIGTGTPLTETSGHLCSTGAIWTNGDWIGGVTEERTARFERAHGDWATRYEFSTSSVYRENLATGDIELIVTKTGNSEPYGDADVDSAGTVAYTLLSNIPGQGFRREIYTVPVGGAATVTIPAGTLGISSPINPVIDESRIAFHARVSTGDRWPLAVQDSIGTEKLDPTSSGPYHGPFPYLDYRANDGWLVYDKLVAGSLQVWTRSPAGVNALAGALSGVTEVAGVNASGEAVYDAAGKRYISSAGAAGPTPALGIGGANGLMRFFGGAWYELKGRDVFRVDPVPAGGGSDGGAPDAGSDASDAGSDAASSSSSSSSGGGSSSGSGADAEGDGGGGGGDGGGGCATAEGPRAPGAALLAMLALAVVSRLRRRRRA